MLQRGCDMDGDEPRQHDAEPIMKCRRNRVEGFLPLCEELRQERPVEQGERRG